MSAGESAAPEHEARKAAIEEGDGTKCRGGAAAFVRRAVQRAEEKRSEQISMYPAPAPRQRLHLFRHEAVSAAEPAFRLYEVEEEDSGELEKRQIVPVIRSWTWGGRSPPRRSRVRTELPKEAAADGLGAERIGRPCRKGEGSTLRGCGRQSGETWPAPSAWVGKVQSQAGAAVHGHSEQPAPCMVVQREHQAQPSLRLSMARASFSAAGSGRWASMANHGSSAVLPTTAMLGTDHARGSAENLLPERLVAECGHQQREAVRVTGFRGGVSRGSSAGRSGCCGAPRYAGRDRDHRIRMRQRVAKIACQRFRGRDQR